MNELALFAGAGGGILGGKLLGWRTVCAVEWDAYARDVLVARQNDGCLKAFPIWDDVQTFDGHPWRGIVDVVSGGFPCQDISAAGKGAGITGERSGMWKHMARIISEVLPRFVFVENSPMLVGRGLAVVLADLAEMGYDAEWGIVGAHHAGAPHKRDRIWIVAYSNNNGASASERSGSFCGSQQDKGREKKPDGLVESSGGDSQPTLQGNVANNTRGGRGERGAWRFDSSDPRESQQPLQVMADTMRQRGDAGESEISEPWNDGASMGNSMCGGLSQSEHESGQERSESRTIQRPCSTGASWWATEPDVGRVAHGVAARVDRLRCIGNGQVPAVVPIARNLISFP
jgi:DNA (cytosine-5)-methyltransferase 1